MTCKLIDCIMNTEQTSENIFTHNNDSIMRKVAGRLMARQTDRKTTIPSLNLYFTGV